MKLKVQISDIINRNIERAERIKKYKEELKEMEEILRKARYEEVSKEDSSR